MNVNPEIAAGIGLYRPAASIEVTAKLMVYT
jgi:hypothetical protein